MKAKVNVIAAMLMFGSIGLFVRGIALPSSVIALVRGVIGCFFLVTVGSLMKQPVNWKAVKSNWLVLFYRERQSDLTGFFCLRRIAIRWCPARRSVIISRRCL